MSQSHVTTDHKTIQQWAEARNGKPAAVASTKGGDDPGILRIDFPGHGGEQSLTTISWEEFFKKFDEKKLAFVYQDELKSGETRRFFKFVSRDSAH